MADIGKLLGSAQILPDELVRIISGTTYAYTPVAGDAWYYKLTNVQVTIQDLIGGTFLQGVTTGAGTDAGSSPAAITTSDLVKFLFIKNTGFQGNGTSASLSSVYLSLDGSSTNNLGANVADCIEIGPNESLALKLNCTVGNLHAEAGNALFAADSSPTITQCIVAAVLDDV